jgi:hypothetical protein
VVVVIVVVIIPIALAAPPMAVFIPPAMAMLPAVGARFREFMARVVCFGTLVAMMFDCFVKPVVRASGTLLTILVSAHRTWDRKQEGSTEGDRGQHSMKEFHVHPPQNSVP